MDILYGVMDEVSLSANELSARLQIPRGFDLDGAERCLTALKTAAVYRYAYVRVPVEVSDGVCRFDFGEVQSVDLTKNLAGCSEVYLLGVTLGIGVDRLLMRLNLTSQAEHFITDALASALAESLCDAANEKLGEGVQLKPRFSPGYGDVPLSVQKPLLSRLQADKTLGITLNGACLMTPMKSITAIVGII